MEHTITKENLFDQLFTRYYLPKAAAEYAPMPTGQTEKVGRHENHHMPGMLLFYDGNAVLGRIEDRFTTSVETSLRGEYNTKNPQELADILDREEDTDHLFTYNSKDGILTRIKTSLNNTAETSYLGFKIKKDVNELLQEKLPVDFISSDYKNEPVINAGSRTRAAVVTVNSSQVNKRGEDRVRAIMISQTIYNNGVGYSHTGKMSELSKSGMTRDVYIYQDEKHTGPFLDESKHLVGVYRTYAPGHNCVELKSQSYISMQNGEMKLTDMTMKYAA